jgi:amidophosphoribosyltransferase
MISKEISSSVRYQDANYTMSVSEAVFKETDKPRNKCSVIGAISFTGRNVAPDVRLGLHATQNRGEDGSGISAVNAYKGTISVQKELGLVLHGFPQGKLDAEGINGSVAAGHNRYATSGSKESDMSAQRKALQPYVVTFQGKSLSLSHNGNIPNEHLKGLKDELPEGIPFESDTDSEILAWRIMHAKGLTFREKIKNGLSGVKGAYSLAITTSDGELFGIRDPLGIKPLAMAWVNDGIAIASETEGFAYMEDATDIREIGRGEMISANIHGDVNIEKIFPETKGARCVVESIYLKHPFSLESGVEVREIRERMGEELAKEFHPPEEAVIIGVPDSGLDIAEGFARKLGRRTSELIRKDRYRPSRTFMNYTSVSRGDNLELKFRVSSAVEGKEVVIIDDSVIRGNTTKKLVNKLRQMGAYKIHVLSGSPQFIEICDMGVDIATKDELIALKRTDNGFVNKSTSEIAGEIGADSIHYLSLEGLTKAINGGEQGFCTHCLSGQHPIRELGVEGKGIYSVSKTKAFSLAAT